MKQPSLLKRVSKFASFYEFDLLGGVSKKTRFVKIFICGRLDFS
jgi:hypothetical protein